MIKRVKSWIKRRRGFTLMEVLVTVLIIGVLAAIAYPVYKKSVTKARAAEAVNLIQMVKDKQILYFSQKGKYFEDFSKIEKLTQGSENIQGQQMTINQDFIVYLNGPQSCVSAYYKKDTPAEFSFSTGYERSGLGCSGGVCNSYGNILGETKSVCNCGSKTCESGFTLNQETCSCQCLLGCESNGSCYSPHGGGQTRTCASGCGTEKSTSTCNGPSWSGACSSPEQKQPVSQRCGRDNSGTQTRTCNPTCGGGECGPWGPCTGQTCDDNIKPVLIQSCGNCGTQTRSITCNGNTGTWNTPSAWGSCNNQGQCSPGANQVCGGGNGSQACSDACGWNDCVCNSGYHMDGGICQPDRIDCPESTKPAASQDCGNCGTQTRDVTCDYTTGKWQEGAWTTCNATGTCSPGETKYFNDLHATYTCDNTCRWASAVCDSGYVRVNGSCMPDCSIAAIKAVNKSYCCTSAPESDSVCYKDCYSWQNGGSGVHNCYYSPGMMGQCGVYGYYGSDCITQCRDTFEALAYLPCSSASHGSECSERDYRDYEPHLSAPCNAIKAEEYYNGYIIKARVTNFFCAKKRCKNGW